MTELPELPVDFKVPDALGPIGVGTLKVLVWPTYVGACQGEPSTHTIWEPRDSEYQRGQISWQLENGVIVGRAKILVPAGEYTHLLYFRHPTLMETVGNVKLPHPIIYFGPGNIIEVYPITNNDLQNAQT